MLHSPTTNPLVDAHLSVTQSEVRRFRNDAQLHRSVSSLAVDIRWQLDFPAYYEQRDSRVHSFATYVAAFGKKVMRSAAKFPVVTVILVTVFLFALVSILLYIIAGLKLIHPYLSFWLLVASGGLSSVVWSAAEEFDGGKES